MIEKHKTKPGRKFDQVRDGARDIFLRDGFAGASVDDIARASKVSKATLYSYFPEKVMMFDEVMRHEMSKLGDGAPIEIAPGTTAREGLPQMAYQIARWLTSGPVVHLHRVGIAEAVRFPEIAQRYHDTLMQVIRDAVRDHLDAWVDGGELSIGETDLAADQLVRLSGAMIQDRALLLGETEPDEASLQKAADSAAFLFLAAHAAPDTDRYPFAAAG